MIRCSLCSWFLGAVTAQVDCFVGTVVKVEGICKRHGRVEAARGRGYDDLFPEGTPDPCAEATDGD